MTSLPSLPTPPAPTRRHILCVQLPLWAIEQTRRRAAPPLRAELLRRPLALVHAVGSRQLVTAVCPAARAGGVRAGMPLAEARAICPGLIDRPAEPDKDLRSLEALGHWFRRRFSPVVSLSPPEALLLDLTGCDRLFGGIDRLVQQIHAALQRLRLTGRLGLASTIGAAWALACPSRHAAQPGQATPDGSPGVAGRAAIVRALSPLHVATLRLDAATIGTLLHLGVETVGQLLAFDRGSLLARFGPAVLTRIDQAIGDAPELLQPLRHRTPVRSRMDFDGPVSSLEAIQEVLRHLVQDLSRQLAVLGAGARRIEAEFRPPYGAPVLKTLLLSRATRDTRTIFNLLRCSTEQLDTGDDGFLRITLTVPLHEQVSDEQPAFDGQNADGVLGARQATAEVMGLVEVLTVRLGSAAVLRMEPRASHLPEQACRAMPAVGPSSMSAAANAPASGAIADSKKASRRTKRVRPDRVPVDATPTNGLPGLRLTPPWEPARPDLPDGIDDPDRTDTPRLAGPADPPAVHAPRAARPLHLLPTPRLLQAMSAEHAHGDDRMPISFVDGRQTHRVAHAAGPERITGPWWEGRDKTRDYYDVETAQGRRLWVFRVAETSRWYLHGGFA